ncbi:protein DEK-like, partial [Manduca sexta]|uniref:protein DEK-like n=1 Tax=Manduca sexta TaxID=7130 RepID=UPI00188E199F
DSKTTTNGKDDENGGEDSKSDKVKAEADSKKEENGETHDDDEKDDVKSNDKGAKKPPPKKKPKKEDTEEEDEDDEDEEEEEDEEGDDVDEEEEKKPSKDKAKKPVKKAKDPEDDGEDEEGDEEEDEEEEEEEEEEAPKPKPKKEPTEPPVPLPAGKGIPLGHISNVEVSLSRFKTQDQKLLHQYLYGNIPSRPPAWYKTAQKSTDPGTEGYEWAIGSTEYKAKLDETTKMELKQLRTMCEMLDLDKKGGPSELAARLVGFLQQPAANSLPHARGVRARRPPRRPRPAAARGAPPPSRLPDEEYETDPETKVKDRNLTKRDLKIL